MEEPMSPNLIALTAAGVVAAIGEYL